MLRRTFLAASVVAGLLVAVPAIGQDQQRLNPNTATAEELAAVPGLDAALAAAITAKRPFPTMVEFDALVKQTAPATDAQKLYEQVFIPINLNTATEEEIALIPGMSKRMIHEFEEYRPYSDIEQFNREIGKYVDEAEVARLRSYVTL